MSARTDPHPQAPTSAPRREERWAAHPVLGGLLRLGIFLLPIACALAATTVARSLLPVPRDTRDLILWWVLLLGLGLLVALAAERLARRLLPLATLLRLSMLFPDRAPSRFRVARQTGSVRQLEEAAANGDAAGWAAAILGLVAQLSSHDRRTRGHAERVRVYTDLIAQEMKLEVDDRDRLRWAALLHDIGKLEVSGDILNKTDELDEAEWDQIRRHPAEGVQRIGPLAEWLGPWADTILHHHERWDGAGYPAGLAGEQICLGARIVAVADTYDTMTSVRSYKRPVATRVAREELVACAGSQFDPVVVRAFLAISLPRLLWATGPVSLLIHVPLLARLQTAGQVGLASAAQAVTATAAAGVIVAGLIAPLPAPADPARPIFERVASEAEGEDDAPPQDREGRGDRGDRGRDDDGGRDDDRDDPDPVAPTPVPPSPQPDTPSPDPTPPEPVEPSPDAPAPNTATVPDIVGLRQGEATTRLEAAGFVVAATKAWTNDRPMRNLVIAQSEPAGSELEIGATVTITVGKFRNKP